LLLCVCVYYAFCGVVWKYISHAFFMQRAEHFSTTWKICGVCFCIAFAYTMNCWNTFIYLHINYSIVPLPYLSCWLLPIQGPSYYRTASLWCLSKLPNAESIATAIDFWYLISDSKTGSGTVINFWFMSAYLAQLE